MASITRETNGRKTIQFVGSDGKRRSIRLGKVPMRQVEAVRIKVEDLASSAITGHAPSDETSRWLVGLDETMIDKLARVGLATRREGATLGVFTREYIDGRVDVKPGTRTNLEQARSYLLDCFDASRQLRDFTAGDAEDFRLRLLGQRKSDNTVRRAIGRARQFFRAAIKRGFIQSNPFEGITASVRADHKRFYFVSRADARKVLNACPDAQWRLIFALARFGGLRCPSEVLELTWADVNWEMNRVRVPSPKTEHHQGRDSRTIPLFPELRPYLLEAFEQAELGTEHVIIRYRSGNANLRTQLHRIIKRAGLDPWPKPFQNLRSTRETELAETFPMHVVCKWIGNSQPVAAEHYLQLTDEHFDRAIQDGHEKISPKAVQYPVQQPAEERRSSSQVVRSSVPQSSVVSTGFDDFQPDSTDCQNSKVPPAGFEPATSGLEGGGSESSGALRHRNKPAFRRSE